MAITGTFHNISDRSKEFADEMDCGWNGYPGAGGIIVSFYDKDEDGFEWEVELEFQPEGDNSFGMGTDAVLEGIGLTVNLDEAPLEHTLNVDVDDIESFAHVAALVMKVRNLKPHITEEQKEARKARLKKEEEDKEKAALEAAKKMVKDLASMGIKAEIKK